MTKVLIGLNGKEIHLSQPHGWCLGTTNLIYKINSLTTTEDLILNSQSLNDESFCALMAEVEGIMNSRPLTVETLSDITSYKPLSPLDLLTMKSKVVVPPAGKFQKEDLYTRKYWRTVQHLANEFWCQQRKEVLLSLQERQEWHLQKWNFMVGEIVRQMHIKIIDLWLR